MNQSNINSIDQAVLVTTAEIIENAEHVVVLSGAGISNESGVPTFRGKDGLWNNRDVMAMATREFFHEDPKTLWEWYNWRRDLISKCEPNYAHEAVVAIEQHMLSRGKQFTLITQNVDGLHRRAGTTEANMIEIHGCLWKLRFDSDDSDQWDIHLNEELNLPCPPFGRQYLEDAEPIDLPLRPHVVWFGESLNQNELTRCFSATLSCDVLLIIGTSAVVQPVASLPFIVAKHNSNAWIVTLNTDQTIHSNISNATVLALAGEALPFCVPSTYKG